MSLTQDQEIVMIFDECERMVADIESQRLLLTPSQEDILSSCKSDLRFFAVFGYLKEESENGSLANIRSNLSSLKARLGI